MVTRDNAELRWTASMVQRHCDESMTRRRFASSRAMLARIVVYGQTSPMADKMPRHAQKKGSSPCDDERYLASLAMVRPERFELPASWFVGRRSFGRKVLEFHGKSECVVLNILTGWPPAHKPLIWSGRTRVIFNVLAPDEEWRGSPCAAAIKATCATAPASFWCPAECLPRVQVQAFRRHALGQPLPDRRCAE